MLWLELGIIRRVCQSTLAGIWEHAFKDIERFGLKISKVSLVCFEQMRGSAT